MASKFTYALLFVVVAFLWKNYVKEGCVYESEVSLEGKTVIITGGNAGIGKATAIECAKRKAHLIIASRNVEKSLAVRDEIAKETGHDDIHVMKLDLGDLDSVTEFANEILAKEKYIDYLVNNAGIMFADGVTKQGFGTLFSVNHLGHFLLTNLLLDRMKEQSSDRPVRIINLSSRAYKWGVIDFATWHKEQPSGSVSSLRAYCFSKLANIYFSSELSKRLEGFNIYSFSLHPGSIGTELFHPVFPSSVQKAVTPIIEYLVKNAYYGCQTTMVSILDDKILENNGDYLSHCKIAQLDAHAKDDSVGEKLWNDSMELVKPWL